MRTVVDRIRRVAPRVGCLVLAGTLAVGTTHAESTAGVKKYDPATVSGEIAKGGYVLILQHAAAGEPEASNGCGDTLSATERDVANAIGKGFRASGIPVSRVAASARCAAVETARALGLGTVEVDADLDPVAVDTTDAAEVGRLKSMLAVETAADSNVLLVSHRDNVNRLLGIDVTSAPGTLHVLRRGDGAVAYVGSVAPNEWPAGGGN